MSEGDALDLLAMALRVAAAAAGPIVVMTLVVGVAVSILQALTQIQEMTLSFVPKLIGMVIVLLLTGSFIGGQLVNLAQQSFLRIEHGF